MSRRNGALDGYAALSLEQAEKSLERLSGLSKNGEAGIQATHHLAAVICFVGEAIVNELSDIKMTLDDKLSS